MGCSASRSQDFISRDQEQPQLSNISSSSSSHLQSPFSILSPAPVSRTLSLPNPLIHHPPLCKGDTNHLVSLTSTTYGSLVLIDHPPKPNLKGQDFMNLSAAKVTKGQNMADSAGDPLSPDSVINTWELMEGLDDLDFEAIESPKKNPVLYNKSKTFDYGSLDKDFDDNELVKTYEIVEHSDSKPLWQHLSEESLLAKLDSNVVSSYRKALLAKQSVEKEVQELPSEPPMATQGLELSSNKTSLHPETEFSVPCLEPDDRVVLYFTSLRGIRKTYEECCTVRMIFKGFGVLVDERDISMDSSYRNELQNALKGKVVGLPQVFVRGRYIGGAEEIKQLHEAGELAKLLKGIPLNECTLVCGSCGDARFVPCSNCNGSRKIFELEEGKLRRCTHCNENGLIRCPSCCS